MQQIEKFKYTLTFEKSGIAAYTSHLDVVRTFSRALARAKVLIYYTEGFTRRPYLVFPYPLPLGIVGENEFMEFALLEKIADVNDFTKNINAVLPTGFRVLSISSDEFPTVNHAIYEISNSENIDISRYDSFFAQDKISAEKFSKKKGNITIDLKPLIENNTVSADGTLTVTLPVGDKGNINVNVLIKSLSDFLGINAEEFCAKRIKFLP